MPLRFEHLIAMRYLKPRKGAVFISIIGIISVLGVMTGVTAIILVLSVLNGFEREVQSRFIGFDAHLKIRHIHEDPFAYCDSLPEWNFTAEEVTGQSPYILEKAMITSAEGSHVSFVKGVLSEKIVTVTDIEKDLTHGAVTFASDKTHLSGIVIGYSLAMELEAGMGDTLTVISPAGITNPFDMPRARRFAVTGIFKTDMFEYDNAYAFIALSDAQDLFEKENRIDGIDLRLADIRKSFDRQKALQARLGDTLKVETWYDQHRDLYSAMVVEKWGSLVLLCLIILVAGFNIVSTLIMIVMQKTSEIGILKSLGANDDAIARIFIRQGLIVGGIGIGFGYIVGYAICILQMNYGFVKLPSDVFFLDAVPVELKWIDFILIFIVSFLLILMSTIYPARKAAQLVPVEALKA